MIIYSNLIKLFKHCGNYILFKLIMNIHEYSEYLDYFFDTLGGDHRRGGEVSGDRRPRRGLENNRGTFQDFTFQKRIVDRLVL